MADYNIGEIAERYKNEQGRMYAGAYEWMIKEIQRLTVRKGQMAESAAKRVLRNPNSSKSAKTKSGSALSRPIQSYKLRRP